MKGHIKIAKYNFSVTNVGSYSFAFISDLHDVHPLLIMDAIYDIGVDAILVPGDFIHNSSLFKRGLDFLSSASYLAPTFCSLGNHEMKFDGDIKTLVKDTGAILLDNESYMFGGVNIGGLTSGYKVGQKQKRFGETPAPDLEWLEEYSKQEGYKILMSHHPEYYDSYIKKAPIGCLNYYFTEN